MKKKEKKEASQHHNITCCISLLLRHLLKLISLRWKSKRDARCLWAERRKRRSSIVVCCLSQCLSICSCLAFFVSHSFKILFCFSASGEMTLRTYFFSYFGFLHECVVLGWITVISSSNLRGWFLSRVGHFNGNKQMAMLSKNHISHHSYISM